MARIGSKGAKASAAKRNAALTTAKRRKAGKLAAQALTPAERSARAKLAAAARWAAKKKEDSEAR